MALDLGELVARLRVDDSQYVAGLKAAPATARTAGQQIGDGIVRGADGKLRGARGQMTAAGRGLGQGVGAGVESGFKPSLGRITGLLATLGLGKLAIDAGKFGLEVYSSNEKAAISFTTMLGSAEKAQTFLGQMKDFAAQTPFEFPELQTASSRLISAGVESGKVIPIMKTLGDVTSGMGTGSEGITRATTALQQMQAAGRITGEDLNQLRDAGIPVYDLLAAATGKSKAEVVKLAQAGKLGKKELDAMMKALETGKGMEKFSGLMAEQSKSLDGMLSNLKDSLGQGLASAIDSSGLDDDFKGAITAVTAALPGLIANVKGFVDWLRQMGQWVQQNSSWLTPLAAVLGGAAAGILVVVGAMRAWAVVQGILNVVMAANPIGIVVVAIAALVAGLIYAYNTSEDFRNAVNAAFTAVGIAARWLWNNAIAPALRAMVNGFAWVVEGIAGMLRALGNVPGFEWARDAADNLDGMAKSARDAANGIKDIPEPKVDTGKSRSQVEELDKKIRNLKGKIVDAKANGAKESSREVQILRDKIAALRDKKVTVTAKIVKSGSATWSVSGSGKSFTLADGGIMRFFAGGGMKENHVGQIARAGDWRVWAEPETGDEAYLPLGASKRSGSIPIWLEVGRRLGMLASGAGMVPSTIGAGAARSITAGASSTAAGSSNPGVTVADVRRMLDGLAVKMTGADVLSGVIYGRLNLAVERL